MPAPPPFCYMRTGFGPSTYKRGIRLKRLGRELNPFPLVQLPSHRLVNPWTLGAILHEVSHNLQTDLGLSRAVPLAIGRRLLRAGLGMEIAKVWVRWNRETFADLSAVLLGGPAVVASLMDVVGRAPQISLFFSPTGVHPTPYLRVLMSVELLRRMGFKEEAEKFWPRVARPLSRSENRQLPTEVLAHCCQSYSAGSGHAVLPAVRGFGRQVARASMSVRTKGATDD